MTDTSSSSRALALLTALTCGTLIALALQVLLSHYGMQIADVWREMTTSERFRAAMVWWIIAGVTLVTGAVVARPLAQFKPPWVRLRALRWIVGAAIVAALAHVAHQAELPEGVTPMVQLMASGAAITLGAVMASFGAMFAMRA
jgi:hypothetical protein